MDAWLVGRLDGRLDGWRCLDFALIGIVIVILLVIVVSKLSKK